MEERNSTEMEEQVQDAAEAGYSGENAQAQDAQAEEEKQQ